MYDAPQADRGPVREAPRRTSPSAAGWIALAIWSVFAILALLLAVGSVSAFSRLTEGLPPVSGFDQLGFIEQSVILDRTGTIELARFGGEKREIVEFKDIPPIVIDAQTAVEDKTFWENSGFDPVAIFAAGLDSLRGNSRGASTITQQLVRQRLLPDELVQDPHRTLERKLKEIIQSIRLTEAYPGLPGKQKIIAAYLNQNYYGNQSYGVKAAAKSYFNKDLADLTLAEAAILAGMAKSPSNYDLVKNAEPECATPDPENSDNCLGTTTPTLKVPDDSPIVQRRNQILDLLAGGRTTLSGQQFGPADFERAKQEEVIVAPQATTRWIAPHFVWAVQQELAEKLCGPDVPTCDQLSAGGLTITTTLDAGLQKIAEKWVRAATDVPNAKNPATVARKLGVPYEQWMKNLKGKDLNNGALVAYDYQTGQLIAYVGSANYYAAKSTKQFQAKYDVVGSGFRQPGSAFKPFNYLTGIDDKNITAASMLMDTATDFGGKYTPSDADTFERGPVRVRTALQFSLNIPSVKTAQINDVQHVFSRARDFGMVFATDQTNAGLAIALGVQEVRPVDLVTAYGTLANGGKKVGHTTILSATNQAGEDVVPAWTAPKGDQVATPQAAFIVTDILAGNTNPKVNPFWGKFQLIGPGKERRPATLKTGTNNDAKDLNAYGFIAPPTEKGRTGGEYALAVGVWNGNSDNSVISPNRPVFSIDVTTFIWQGFFDEASKKWAVNDFQVPDGLAKAKVDPFTGLQPTAGKTSIEEWFIPGTEPKSGVPEGMCGEAVLDQPGIYEGRFANWKAADLDWLARAEKGPGTAGGVNRTRTAYFYNGQFQPYGRSWGALVEGHGCAAPSPMLTCYPVPTPDESGVVPSFVVPTPDPSASVDVIYEPCPTEIPSAPPSVEPSAEPTPTATPPPTPAPTPAPTATPAPTGTPAPTATPAPSAAAASGAVPAGSSSP